MNLLAIIISLLFFCSTFGRTAYTSLFVLLCSVFQSLNLFVVSFLTKLLIITKEVVYNLVKQLLKLFFFVAAFCTLRHYFNITAC